MTWSDKARQAAAEARKRHAMHPTGGTPNRQYPPPPKSFPTKRMTKSQQSAWNRKHGYKSMQHDEDEDNHGA